MQLYFVRHGESEIQISKIISRQDEPTGLTPRGIEQVKALCPQIRSVDRIFSSPLARAVQTAEILAAHFELDFEIADALREFDSATLCPPLYLPPHCRGRN